MESLKKDVQKLLLCFFLFFSAVCVVTGLVVGGADALTGLVTVMTSTEKLTTDVLAPEMGGLGGGLLSVGIVGLISWGVLKFSKAKVSGASFGAFFLMVGFAFFGKNPLNILPIIAGTFLYSKVKKKPFGDFANMSLFGCALAPAVSEFMFGTCNPWSKGVGILVGVVVGLLIGFVFAPVASHTATMHKGFDLFNAGLAAGLMGIIIFLVYKQIVLVPAGSAADYAANSIKGESHQMFFNVFIGAISAASILFGAVLNGGFKGYGALLKRTGHKTDFAALDGGPLCLINFGVLGFFGLAYLNLVKAPFTGPVIGALLCLMCWAANGSHVLNVWPIFAGYALVSLAQGTGFAFLAGQGIAVGVMFASGLSPIAGKYKFWWGIIASAMHACLVSYTAGFHGWMNCYNGGFTAGLVAMVLVVILEALIPEKEAAA
ncbi:MAG: DUF1576 domain-containing protein [Eubacteriaceae bacterium]|nr:DUF1576 domain-containing protein [Eubacteriaceae bacterium]